MTVTAGTRGWAGLMCSVVLGFVVFVGGRSDDPLTPNRPAGPVRVDQQGMWGRESAGGCRYL